LWVGLPVPTAGVEHVERKATPAARRQDEQDMNKKMARSKDHGLHTKQEGVPDNESGGVGTGTVSTGGSSDGTGTV